jgi:hypothetical protein
VSRWRGARAEPRETRGRVTLGLFGVVLHAGDVHLDTRLVPTNPGVVAWWDHHDVVGTDVLFGAIVHPDAHPTGDAVGQVRRLTALGFSDRLHVLGPAPARLERSTPDRARRQLDHIDSALVDNQARLIRLAGVPYLKLGHGASLIVAEPSNVHRPWTAVIGVEPMSIARHRSAATPMADLAKGTTPGSSTSPIVAYSTKCRADRLVGGNRDADGGSNGGR